MMQNPNTPAKNPERIEDPFHAPEATKATPQESVQALSELLRVKNERMEAMKESIPDDPRAREQFDAAYIAVQARKQLLETVRA